MSEAIAELAQRAVATATAQPEQTAAQPAIEQRIKHLFMLLHGRYGTAFTSKFATGKLDVAGSDRGTLSAMLVWQSDLRRYADDVVQEAAQRCKDANPTFPPSLPEFEALCKVCMPRETYAQQQGWKPLPPRIGPMSWPGCIVRTVCTKAGGISDSGRQPRSPPSSALGLSE